MQGPDISAPDAIALFASSRRAGNTGRFIDRIALSLGIQVVDLGSLCISNYDYEYRNRDDDFEPLMRRVLVHPQIIFASPVYWYSVSPAMKVFLDRISDYLELPDLLAQGHRLRGKNAYLVCTSVSDAASPAFVGAMHDTFDYLGMHQRGVAHINCADGYSAAMHDPQALAFAALVRAGT